MKKRIAIISLLLLSITIQCSSQAPMAYRMPASEKVIPKIATTTFNLQYPDVLLKGWYVTHITYWQNDVSAGWYSDWYGERTVIIYTFEKPTYFEVEFVKNPGEVSRSIYNLYGYWYETRSQTKGLPLSIIEALKQTEYAGWKISTMKERIESPSWPGDIYRFQVYKGLKSRIIRMDEKGNIIQAKILDE